MVFPLQWKLEGREPEHSGSVACPILHISQRAAKGLQPHTQNSDSQLVNIYRHLIPFAVLGLSDS